MSRSLISIACSGRTKGDWMALDFVAVVTSHRVIVILDKDV